MELAPHLFLYACADVFLTFVLCDLKCLLQLKLKNKNQGTRYFSSWSLCFVPQCYDYKHCCHLRYFVLFAGFLSLSSMISINRICWLFFFLV